jgi:hypothetical protein
MNTIEYQVGPPLNRPVCWLSMTVLHSPALSFLQARWLWLDLKLHGSA